MGLFGPDKEEDDKNSEEEKYYCDTCGKEISEERYFETGQCTNCEIEDGAIAGGLV